ncbi:MAG: cation-translocating P-type ATPase [Pseudomonadota bacterium]
MELNVNAAGSVRTDLLSRQLGDDLGGLRYLGLRLVSVLVGGGLLGVGWAWGRLQADQAAVAAGIELVAALIVGWSVLWAGARGFWTRDPGSYTDQLVSLAILAAMISGDFITAGLVPLLMEVGHLLEERSVQGARAAIDGIRKLHARTATRLVEGREQVVPTHELAVGDRVIVRPGETIPADAVVLEGAAAVDQSSVTGESMLEDLGPGSRAFAGTVALDGMLTLEVKGVGRDTALGRVMALLHRAEHAKAPVTRLLERYAGAYLPVVLAVAAVVLFATGDVGRAIAVLVVACPCALVLSGPVAMVAALAVAARWSILIKGASFLERVSEVDTVVLDKTGTVTLGALGVLAIHPREGLQEEDLLRLAASCGHGSLHPASRAVVEAARQRGLSFEPPSALREQAGLGVEATTGSGTLLLGRASWLRQRGLTLPEVQAERGIAVWLAREGEPLGWFELADRPRPEAAKALQALRDQGARRLVLLTGDRREVAEAVAAELGFDQVEAEVLPERKAELIEAEQAAGRRVMMVGDGVNDALALHRADVGVAVGAVINEVALGGADIALMGNNLARLPQMVELAARTRRTINVNVLVGAGFSVVMLTLAAIGVISPLWGALLHNGGAIFVVFNSARLLALGREG